MATAQLIHHLRDHLLTCAICEDVYLDPRTLQCLHSFCLRCIQQWSTNKGPGEAVQCPSCRHVTDLGPSGGRADGLPKAFFLGTLHGILQGYQDTLCTDDEPLQCFHCSASTVCKACNMYLCDHCADKHRQDQTTREHRTIALPAVTDGGGGGGGGQASLRRGERRAGSSQRLSRSASTGEQGGITLQGLFRRSRSADRTKGSRNRAPDGSGGGGGGGEANPTNSFHSQSLARCRYLSHPLSKFTIRGSGRSVWGVATLSNRIYVVTYCSSVIDVYEGEASYDRIGSISVDGLKDPWDMVACRRRGCLYVADWKSKSVFAVHPGHYDDREVIRCKSVDPAFKIQ